MNCTTKGVVFYKIKEPPDQEDSYMNYKQLTAKKESRNRHFIKRRIFYEKSCISA